MKFSNKLYSFLLLFTLFLFSLPGASCAGDSIYQYSIIDSLLAGNYDGELTVGTLKNHGDTGLGTFNRLDGEMVFLDGEVYKINAHGEAIKMDDGERTPFAAAAFFKTGKIIKLDSVNTLKELNHRISNSLDSENLFYIIRIDGKFRKIRTRSVPAQQKPYPPLKEVVKDQSIFAFKDVTGTLIGIKSPSYVKGIGVPGFHWHFITEERTSGGHVLNCIFNNLAAKVGTYSEFHLQLPENKSFLDSKFEKDRQKELKEVEKDSEKK
ncbi:MULTISPECIES: acetolactate decarboxylase [unclassified Maridesulfovibrio]|uniref:acetolactate decarboxylase n=1 Tax=unclassified Maridesulfovibrio TaxID=2794999 RepID=UPI003B3F0C58